jgi:hypothetical protein
MSKGTGGRKIEARAFNGKLDNIPLPEVLNFLSVTAKSGRLSLTARDAQGLIVLRRGRIIYAASSSVRMTLGNIMVCRGLVPEAVLLEALERQHFGQDEKRLGAVLVEMGRVSPEDVEEVVRYQIGLVLAELCQWPTGFFKFDAMELPEGGEIEVDAQDFVAAGGVSTDGLLLQIATEIDESHRHPQAPPTPQNADMTPPAGVTVVTPPPPVPAVPLEGLVAEIQTPALRGEISGTLMRLAARSMSRGILFAVHGDTLTAIGHFGFDGEGTICPPPTRLQLPVAEPSVFADVVQRKETYWGPLPPGVGNDRLREALGREVPGSVVVVPMIMSGKVATLFYGDDLPGRKPMGDVRPLEVLMTEAGLEMERLALEGRIKNFERTRKREEFLRALQSSSDPKTAAEKTSPGRERPR